MATTFTPDPAPSVGTQVKTKARVDQTELGDGYSAVSLRGINNLVDTVELTWRVVTRAQAAGLDYFFRVEAGRNFRYNMPPDYSGAQSWHCNEWTRNHVDEFVDSFSATLVESFNL
jgi:phage-related protein